MKTNFHTHTKWCDGKNTPEEMIEAAIEKGFSILGFSSHAMLPESECGTLSCATAPEYAREIRRLADRYANRIRIRCGIEADFIPGYTTPDRQAYASIRPDYVLGSIHFVLAPDGARVPVDHTPELLTEGIDRHFSGDARAFVKAYFAAERDMATTCRFDVVGHPDLVRKFNGKLHYFDEAADWYIEELRATADAIAASGKLTEVNTGAISRGWMDDAYPSASFREMLRARGVRFILSSDAHAADALDCAFDRFTATEDYVTPGW